MLRAYSCFCSSFLIQDLTTQEFCMQELIDEGADNLLLTKDMMDRALMARLMLPTSSTTQPPVPYLLDVYARASNELRGSAQSEKSLEQQLTDIATYAQELAISHAHLALTVDLFPQVCLLPLTDPKLRAFLKLF